MVTNSFQQRRVQYIHIILYVSYVYTVHSLRFRFYFYLFGIFYSIFLLFFGDSARASHKSAVLAKCV